MDFLEQWKHAEVELERWCVGLSEIWEVWASRLSSSASWEINYIRSSIQTGNVQLNELLLRFCCFRPAPTSVAQNNQCWLLTPGLRVSSDCPSGECGSLLHILSSPRTHAEGPGTSRAWSNGVTCKDPEAGAQQSWGLFCPHPIGQSESHGQAHCPKEREVDSASKRRGAGRGIFVEQD